MVGGGAAGVGAAVGAAKAGARVVLIERYGFLGGMATAAQVGTICGLFLRESTGAGTWAVQGFPRELAERLAQRSDTEPMSWRHGLRFLPYEPFALRLLCDEVLQEHGVDVRLHTSLIAVHGRPGGLTGVRALSWDRPLDLPCDALVDTTGTAAAATLAGASVRVDPVHQAPAIVFGLSGIGEVERLGLRLALLRAVRRAVAAGDLPDQALALSIVPGSHRGEHVLLKLGLIGGLPDAPDAITLAEQEARRLVDRLTRVLRRHEPVFAKARLVDVSSQIGVRTGRRLVGRTELTDDDVLHARPSAEGVALGAWPVELWGEADQPEMIYPPEGAACEIPAGCLESVDRPGVYAAGRCLSARTRAIAAVRVIGTCLATGYAAGTLAAAHAAGRDRGEAIARAREALLPAGLSPRG